MKINEVDPRNYDSDIDYYNAVRRSGRRPSADDYEPPEAPEPYDPEDEIAQRRQRAQAKADSERKTTWDTKTEGSAPNGQKFNSRYIIDAPSKASADSAAYTFNDMHWGAKKVVDQEYKENNGRVELTLYVVDNHKHGTWKPWADQPAQESIEQGVAEGSRVKEPSGNYRDPHTGRLYSSPDGKDGNDGYMTPEYMLDFYKKKLAQIAAGPYKRTKEVAQLQAKIAKLEKQGVAEAMTPQQQHDFDRMRAGAMSRKAYDAKWKKPRKSDDEVIYGKKKGVAEGQTPEQEIERLKLRQNAEHGGASLKRQASTQARIRELEKQIKDKKQGVAEGSPLDRVRDKLSSQGYAPSQQDRLRDRERSQEKSDAIHQSFLNRQHNSSQMDDARTQHEIDVLAHRLQRMQRDDDDHERTMNMFRDRLNRYQYGTQRDVDPEQLAAISNIQYQPRRKKTDFVPKNEGAELDKFKTKSGKFPEPRDRKPGQVLSKSETLGKDGKIYHWQDPRAKQDVAEGFNGISVDIEPELDYDVVYVDINGKRYNFNYWYREEKPTDELGFRKDIPQYLKREEWYNRLDQPTKMEILHAVVQAELGNEPSEYRPTVGDEPLDLDEQGVAESIDAKARSIVKRIFKQD